MLSLPSWSHPVRQLRGSPIPMVRYPPCTHASGQSLTDIILCYLYSAVRRMVLYHYEFQAHIYPLDYTMGSPPITTLSNLEGTASYVLYIVHTSSSDYLQHLIGAFRRFLHSNVLRLCLRLRVRLCLKCFPQNLRQLLPSLFCSVQYPLTGASRKVEPTVCLLLQNVRQFGRIRLDRAFACIQHQTESLVL